jgi:hypothetical protein
MSLPSSENLKAKVHSNPREIDKRVEHLKASLRSAFRSVKWANKKSHLRNKRYHDRYAKHREFGVGDLVYLYQPVRRPGLSAKFFYPWTGPHQITAKLSTLNYEIQDRKAKKQVVHINGLKTAHYPARWKPVNINQARKPNSKRLADRVIEVEVEFRSRPIPVVPEAPIGFRRMLAPTPVVPQPTLPILDNPVRRGPTHPIFRPLLRVPGGMCTQPGSSPRLLELRPDCCPQRLGIHPSTYDTVMGGVWYYVDYGKN